MDDEERTAEEVRQVVELIASVYPPDDPVASWSPAALSLLQDAAATTPTTLGAVHIDITLNTADASETVVLRASPLLPKRGFLQIVSHSKDLAQPLAEVKQLIAANDNNEDDDPFGQLMTAVDMIKTVLDSHDASAQANEPATLPIVTTAIEDIRQVRTWFHFPSLSTRSKRTDLVKYAQARSLTGFVLAGKPGLCVLEGAPTAIDSFWHAIKTESWADIPSHHKKVSERLRLPITARAWVVMEEITDTIEKGGHRGNKSEMGEVRTYCHAHGVAEELDQVLRI